MQPEWIMEAMGLREITDRDEAARASVSAQGDKPGDPDPDPVDGRMPGEAANPVHQAETLVNESDRRDQVEHRLYSGAQERPPGQGHHLSVPTRSEILPTDDEPSGSKVVQFPSKIQAGMDRREVFHRDHDGRDYSGQPPVPGQAADANRFVYRAHRSPAPRVRISTWLSNQGDRRRPRHEPTSRSPRARGSEARQAA